MNDISKARCEALAAFCRQPGALFAAEELRWLEAHDEAMRIVVFRDVADRDYAAMVLARDMMARSRWAAPPAPPDTVDQALAAAPEVVERVFIDFDKQRTQGDEKRNPVDFFTPLVPKEKLNRDFATITALEGYSPAVELIKPMMRWYEDADGNFVEQFQTTGFDTRLWELYIFAMLVEAGYVLDRSVPIPDFQARNAFGEICIEATTVNLTRDAQGLPVPPPPLDTEEQIKQFQQVYFFFFFVV